jgi:hypothetical protein
MSYGSNGSVIGPENAPSKASSSGVWSLGEVAEASRDGVWPGPPVGWFLNVKNYDGATSNTPLNLKRIMALSSSADKIYQFGTVAFGGSPLQHVQELLVTESTGAVAANIDLDSTYEMNVAANAGKGGWVDSSDNIYGYFDSNTFTSGVHVGSAFYKRNSSGTLQWVAGVYKTGAAFHIYGPDWYPANVGGYKFVSANPNTDTAGPHYGKRLLVAALSDSTWPLTSATPTAQQAMYSSRETSHQFVGIDAYGGGTDGTYIYTHCSDYNDIDGQGPVVAKWSDSLSSQWMRKFAVGTGSGTLITQAGFTNSSGVTTMMGYQSTGSPYPLFLLQVNSSGALASQRQWVHGTASNHFWPYQSVVDSSGNFYIVGWWQDETDTGNWKGRPTIFKIDSSLNKVWIASCTATYSGTTDIAIPYSTTLTSDGGIAIGFAFERSGTQYEMGIMKMDDLENPDGRTVTVGNWTFTWADTTSIFTESTPTHTVAATSYINTTSSPGYTWTTKSPTSGTWTSTDAVGNVS